MLYCLNKVSCIVVKFYVIGMNILKLLWAHKSSLKDAKVPTDIQVAVWCVIM
jgi:hypothetical protein